MAERGSLQAFPGKMAAAAVAVKLAAPKASAAGALVLTQATRVQIRTVAPSLYMRGVGARGAAVGVTFNARPEGSFVRATGPLHLLERDSKAHAIAAKRAKRLRLPSTGGKDTGVRTGSVKHPGTTGKHPFAKGIAAGLPPARAAITATLTQATTQALR